MKKLASLIAAFVLTFSFCLTPVYAAEESKTEAPKASILTGCAGAEDGTICILNLVADILSIGIGILGVIGITIVGIQYLTAGGNEEKTRKAKQRMFEIVIGLVSYVIIFAVLKWLMPGFGS